MRLQKMIAMKSEYSRRKAEELIKEYRVSVNGEIVTEMGVQVTEKDEIVIDDKVLFSHDKIYFLMNKPSKVISSTSDDKNRQTVIGLIHATDRIYPVGRLDYETTGLLLLTNDGELANKLMHPSTEIQKKYSVKVKGDFNKDKASILANGVLVDGNMTSKCQVRIKKMNKAHNTTDLEMTIHEGRNRQIRKMLEAVGCEVINLKRIEYAIFDLKQENLGKGEYRELSIKEIKKLYALVGISRE